MTNALSSKFGKLFFGAMLFCVSAKAEVRDDSNFLDSHPLVETGIDDADDSDWESFFKKHQRAAIREDFFRCLYSLVPRENMPEGFVSDLGSHAEIRDASGKVHILHFAKNRSSALSPSRYWRHPSEVGSPHPTLPLGGARICIDPGHIGGRWAGTEGRLFYGRCGTRIAEGDMNLIVAFRLKSLLERAGAEVWMTRKSTDPIHGDDPSVFFGRAVENLRRAGSSTSTSSVRREADRLHLQVAEIEARADLVNKKIKPDMVICLHFNAESWGDPRNVKLSPRNHMHVLVGGSYLPEELEKSENRLDLIRRALEGTHLVEIPLARAVARRLASETELPAFSYGNESRIATADDESPYVWKRNLLATRKFQCPVIYPEPYVMNNSDFIADVAAARDGDWSLASNHVDIFDRYARGVFGGVLDYWRSRRGEAHGRGIQSGHKRTNGRRDNDPFAPRWVE